MQKKRANGCYPLIDEPGLPLDDAFCSPLPPEMEGEEGTDAFQLSDLDYSVTEGPSQRRCLAGGGEEGRRQIE